MVDMYYFYVSLFGVDYSISRDYY